MTECRYSGWLRGCGRQGWLSLLLLLPLLASAQPDEAALRTKDIELKRLREQITHLQSTLKGGESERQRQQAELQASERLIGEVTRHLRVLAGSLERQKQRLGKLREKQQAQQ
ncbi:MAG: hypothetical protein ABW168_25290, partial [Sedimenticola sp.]